MNLRTMLVVGMAVVFGGSAATGVHFARAKPGQETASVTLTPILVAAVEIPRGTSLREELIKTRDWPAGLLPEGALVKKEDVLGRVLLTPVVPGEPLLKGKVGDVGIGASCLVKPGMRAYTISTPTVAQGVSGFVLPGNHVDVLLTVTKMNRDDSTGGGVTTTLLQNVEILAADQRLDSAETKTDAKQTTLKSVTLLVTPEMAAKLSLAQTAGTLHLSLRNDTDQSIADTNPVTMRELRFQQDAMPSELPAAKVAAGEQGAAGVATTAKRVQPPMLIRSLRGNSSGLIYVTQN